MNKIKFLRSPYDRFPRIQDAANALIDEKHHQPLGGLREVSDKQLIQDMEEITGPIKDYIIVSSPLKEEWTEKQAREFVNAQIAAMEKEGYKPQGTIAICKDTASHESINLKYFAFQAMFKT